MGKRIRCKVVDESGRAVARHGRPLIYGSLKDAEKVAKELGNGFRVVPITIQVRRHLPHSKHQ